MGTWNILVQETYNITLGPLMSSFSYNHLKLQCGHRDDAEPSTSSVVNPFIQMMAAGAARRVPKAQNVVNRKNELFNKLRENIVIKWNATVADTEGASILQVRFFYFAKNNVR